MKIPCKILVHDVVKTDIGVDNFDWYDGVVDTSKAAAVVVASTEENDPEYMTTKFFMFGDHTLTTDIPWSTGKDLFLGGYEFDSTTKLKLDRLIANNSKNKDIVNGIRTQFIAIGAPLNDNDLDMNEDQIKWCQQVLRRIEQLNF